MSACGGHEPTFEVGVALRNGKQTLIVAACGTTVDRLQLVSGDRLEDISSSSAKHIDIAPGSLNGGDIKVVEMPVQLPPSYDFSAAGPPSGWAVTYEYRGESTFSDYRGSGTAMLPTGPWPEYPEVSTADGSDITIDARTVCG